MKQIFKSLVTRLNNKGTIVSLAALIVSLLCQFGLNIDSEKILTIVQTICSILIILGLLNDPTDSTKGYIPGISDKLVNKIFNGDAKKALGEEIVLETSGESSQFTIIGVYEYQANYMMGAALGSGDDVTTNLYMPLKAAFNYEHSEAYYQYVQVTTEAGVDADLLASKIENFFEPYYRNNRTSELNAITVGSMVSMLTDMLSTITLAISIVAGIALVVGGIGVMNIMLVSITERTKEIGTRKALGAKNSSIRIQFIVEAVIICLIGGAIGVVVGIGGGVLASNLLGYPARPSIPGIIISLIFSMAIGVFFGYYPANKAAKMNPIDALRYE